MDENTTFYRVVRDEENLNEDIVSKDPDAKTTVAQHIASGSKYSSQYISTTLSLEVAIKWAFYDLENGIRIERELPLRIIEFKLSKLSEEAKETMINLTDEGVRENFIKGATHQNWAKSSQEVLFLSPITNEAISEVVKPKVHLEVLKILKLLQTVCIIMSLRIASDNLVLYTATFLRRRNKLP